MSPRKKGGSGLSLDYKLENQREVKKIMAWKMDVPFNDMDIWCPVASFFCCTQLGKDMQDMWATKKTLLLVV